MAASSQYIDTGSSPAAANRKSSQNSTHHGLRMRAGSVGNDASSAFQNPGYYGFMILQNGYQQMGANDGSQGVLSAPDNPVAPAHFIATRTGPTAAGFYRNGTLKQAFIHGSTIQINRNIYIGGRNNAGTPDNFTSARYSLSHAGGGLTDMQAATLTTLFDLYSAAVAEI